MEIKKFEDWILFWEKVFLSLSWKILENKINLLQEKWEDIRKETFKNFIIDYPWEYEKFNIFIKVLIWQTDRLNFFIHDYNNKNYYAFIQDPSVLENLDLSTYPEIWYFQDEIIEKQIERLWFEWDCIKI